MSEKLKKVMYIKHSSAGVGSIPLQSIGTTLIFAKHPITTKLLVDFYELGKAIVPLSSVKFIEEEEHAKFTENN